MPRHRRFVIDERLELWKAEVEETKSKIEWHRSEITRLEQQLEVSLSTLEAFSKLPPSFRRLNQSSTDERNQYIYEEYIKKGDAKKKLERILARVNRHATWPKLKGIPQIIRIVDQYSEKHKKDTPRRRRPNHK